MPATRAAATKCALSQPAAKHDIGALRQPVSPTAACNRAALRSELQHVAEYGDFPRTGHVDEQVERGRHRAGTGVVAIVDYCNPIFAHDLAAMAHRLGTRQGRAGSLPKVRRGCDRRRPQPRHCTRCAAPEILRSMGTWCRRKWPQPFWSSTSLSPRNSLSRAKPKVRSLPFVLFTS